MSATPTYKVYHVMRGCANRRYIASASDVTRAANASPPGGNGENAKALIAASHTGHTSASASALAHVSHRGGSSGSGRITGCGSRALSSATCFSRMRYLIALHLPQLPTGGLPGL